MTFACLTRIGFAWLGALALVLFLGISHGGAAAVETLISHNYVTIIAAILSGMLVGMRTADTRSPALFAIGAVLFLSSLFLVGFLTGASQRFPARLSGNTVFDYEFVFGSCYLLFATMLFLMTRIAMKYQRDKRD
jgi:hypothetical protein